MTRRAPPTFPPPRRPADPVTFKPTTPIEWETRATMLVQERNRLRQLVRELIVAVEVGYEDELLERARRELGEEG